MKMKIHAVCFTSSLFVLLLAGATTCFAQIDHNIISATKSMTSHIDGVTGHAYGDGQLRPDAGVQLYRRYCVGCHGAEGNGEGENALQWIRSWDIQSRAISRSQPSNAGQLQPEPCPPTRTSSTRSLAASLLRICPPGAAYDSGTGKLIAMVKAFSPRWTHDKPGTPIVIPPEPPLTIDSILRGRKNFDRLQCWKCHGPQGYGDGPSAPTAHG